MKILPKRATLDNWLNVNPIPLEGHVIWIKDKQISLIGDGESTFVELYRIYKYSLRKLTGKVTFK